MLPAENIAALEDRCAAATQHHNRTEQQHQDQLNRINQKHQAQLDRVEQKHEEERHRLEQKHQEEQHRLEQKCLEQLQKAEQVSAGRLREIQIGREEFALREGRLEARPEATEKRIKQLEEEKSKLEAKVAAQYGLLRFTEGVIVGRRQAHQEKCLCAHSRVRWEGKRRAFGVIVAASCCHRIV